MRVNDLSAIEHAYEQTWPSPVAAGKPIGSLYTRYCLMHYLCASTRCEVAVDGEEVLGVTMARVKGEPSAFVEAEELLDSAALLLERHPVGSRLLAQVRARYRAEDQLRGKAQLADDSYGELELFLVMPDARGLGVGGRLFERARQYFVEHQARRFFLFTDTDSDFGFYEHQHMRRAAQGSGGADSDELYIYVGLSAHPSAVSL